ncbi:MAG TPA: outer membrane beta-barrel protein [Blastocatellia bacterium]|nr:outer membrane beta-barrel protein [Blastocatellia bacterium]
MDAQTTGLASRLRHAVNEQTPASTLLRTGALLMFLLLSGNISSARAQGFQLGIDFTTVIPKGEFSQNITNNGYGIGGQFLVGVSRLPISVGFDGAFTTYGSEEHKEPISTTIPELRVKVRTNNNIALMHVLVRAMPRRGAVRPYLDGLVGFKYLFTDTTILNDANDEELASTKNLSDTTSSYGVGGGVQVRLGGFGRRGDICLDGRVRYLAGGHADYLKKGSIRREDSNVFFDVLSSRTNVLTVQAGITFRF